MTVPRQSSPNVMKRFQTQVASSSSSSWCPLSPSSPRIRALLLATHAIAFLLGTHVQLMSSYIDCVVSCPENNQFHPQGTRSMQGAQDAPMAALRAGSAGFAQGAAGAAGAGRSEGAVAGTSEGEGPFEEENFMSTLRDNSVTVSLEPLPDHAHSNNTSSSSSSASSSASSSDKKICFIKSVFGNSVHEVDTIPDAHLSHESVTSRIGTDYQFYVFTNLPAINATHWNITVLSDDVAFPQNNIVKSRYPKFLSWQIPHIQQSCRLVIYSDGVWISTAPSAVLEGFYERIVRSEAGVMQLVHDEALGPLHELERIEQMRKDTSENVAKERAWLLSQCGFREFSTLYSNIFLLYDPTNVNFRKATTMLWQHYSTESGSWRDQPIYSFVMDQLGLTPLELGKWPQNHTDFFAARGDMGYGGHAYVPEKEPLEEKETLARLEDGGTQKQHGFASSLKKIIGK